MSGTKNVSVRKMKALLQRRERQLAPVSDLLKDEILAKAMELSPGVSSPKNLKACHQKIVHMIYYHFRVANDKETNTTTRRHALDITRRLLSLLDAAAKEVNCAPSAAIETATAKDSRGPARHESTDRASNESGNENFVAVAQEQNVVVMSNNRSSISPRPSKAAAPSHGQVHSTTSTDRQHQLQKAQRSRRGASTTKPNPKFSLSSYCRANDAYKDTASVGIGYDQQKRTTYLQGNVSLPFHQPPAYRQNSPHLASKESHEHRANQDGRNSGKGSSEEAMQAEARRKRLEEQQKQQEQKRAKGKRLKDSEERNKDELEPPKGRQEWEKEEEKRKRLDKQRRIDEDRKIEEVGERVEDEEMKKAEGRKRAEKQKRFEEERKKVKEREQRKKEEKGKQMKDQELLADQKRKEDEEERKLFAQRRQAAEKIANEVSAVMNAAVKPRNNDIRVVYPSDNAKPYKSGSLSERPEVVVRYEAQRLNNFGAEKLATRLSHWDPYWPVCKYIKCGVTAAGRDSDGAMKFGASFDFTISPHDIRGMKTSDWGVNVCDNFQDQQMRLICRMLPVTPTYKTRADIHLWPQGTYVNLNGAGLSLAQRKQQSHNHKKWQGLCHPLDLTGVIRKPTETNEMKILTVEEEPYFFCIALCKYRSPAILMNNYIHSDPAVFHASSFDKLSREQAMIKAKGFTTQATLTLDGSDDDDQTPADESGKFVFTLTCPFSKTILRKPVRGKQCKHYQCFDLSNFVDSNKMVNGNRWRCLVCEHFLSFYDLQLDGLVEELVFEFRKDLRPTDRDRIEYCADGSYALLGPRKQRYSNKKRVQPDLSSSSTVAKKKAAPVSAEPEVILLDDD